MRSILSLFSRSPFGALTSHMENVASCVQMIPLLFDAMEKQNESEIIRIAKQISEFEHAADLTKNDIRNHLPKSIFLPIDRANLLDILSIQDGIADKAEDLAVLVSLKPLVILDSFRNEFKEFIDKNLETFSLARIIIKELNELLESSFGGIEAEKVRSLVDDVAYKEHQVDLLQRNLLMKFYQAEGEMSYGSFYLWQRVFEAISAISNLSENLANRIRMTLELK